MEFDLGHDGNIAADALLSFQAANVLGLTCVLRLEYQPAGTGSPAFIQLELSFEQCRELANQMMIQAGIMEQERPPHSQ